MSLSVRHSPLYLEVSSLTAGFQNYARRIDPRHHSTSSSCLRIGTWMTTSIHAASDSKWVCRFRVQVALNFDVIAWVGALTDTEGVRCRQLANMAVPPVYVPPDAR